MNPLKKDKDKKTPMGFPVRAGKEHETGFILVETEEGNNIRDLIWYTYFNELKTNTSMVNNFYKILTKTIGMKTTCCKSSKYSVIENCPVCTNELCQNYFSPTGLKNIFTISFTTPQVRG
ncbi:MAG: hypothetical protein ABI763_04370 [Bacteroidota bacterium]